jgi:hypothetical protein
VDMRQLAEPSLAVTENSVILSAALCKRRGAAKPKPSFSH